jgi:hypothetical protein
MYTASLQRENAARHLPRTRKALKSGPDCFFLLFPSALLGDPFIPRKIWPPTKLFPSNFVYTCSIPTEPRHTSVGASNG